MKVVIILMAVAAVVRAAVRPETPLLHKRMWPYGPKVTFQQLSGNPFQNLPSNRPTYPQTMHQVHGGEVFYNGQPLFTFAGEDGKRSQLQLQQAIADFGGFHARKKDSSEVFTFQGKSLQAAEDSVAKQVQASDQAARIFGKNVPRIANGFKVFPLPGKRNMFGKVKRPDPPAWRDIHESTPTSPARDLDYLRQELDAKRFLRFSNSHNTLSFAIRALPDGRIEHQLQDAAGNVIHLAH